MWWFRNPKLIWCCQNLGQKLLEWVPLVNLFEILEKKFFFWFVTLVRVRNGWKLSLLSWDQKRKIFSEFLFLTVFSQFKTSVSASQLDFVRIQKLMATVRPRWRILVLTRSKTLLGEKYSFFKNRLKWFTKIFIWRKAVQSFNQTLRLKIAL